MSLNMGDLVPMFCQEVVPGDTFQVNSECLMRLAPMVAPMMHRVDVTMHFFFVPNRLVFDKWDKFITGGLKGEDTPVLPYYALGSSLWDSGILKEGSLLDYMGYPIPTVKPDGSWVRHINALPFRAVS